MKLKHGLSVCIVFIILTVTMLITTAGVQSNDFIPENPQWMVAEIYAKHYGVTMDEALTRLAIQESFPELSTALENNEKQSFGGLWIQHEPEYKIVIAFTNNGELILGKYDALIPENISKLIIIKKVNFSLATLLEKQEKLLSLLEKQGFVIESRIDVTNNCIDIDVAKTDKDRFNSLCGKEGVLVAENLTVNFVDGLSVLATDIYGGLSIDATSGGGSFATMGFAVQNSVGTKGIATAQHVGTTAYYSGTVLPVQNPRLFFGSWDCQWHTCPGFTIDNIVKYSTMGYTYPITATKSRDAQNVGDVVCKYGLTTGFRMGQITSKTHTCPAPTNSATWVEVDNIYGYDLLCWEGDSGGPIFSFVGGTAYGITSRRSLDGQKAYYMAVNYLSNIGVTVLTN